MKSALPLVVVALLSGAEPKIGTYEADSFPENEGWERVGSGRADRAIADGCFVQAIRIEGALDAYQKPLNSFADAHAFFIEWRGHTDAPSFILDGSGVPVVVSASGTSGTNYHTTVTDSRVQFFRDTSIPLVFVDVDPGVPHTYRLELHGIAWFTWYIDGEVVDTGKPEGTYPTSDSMIIWGSRHYVQELPAQTTRWHYIRYGLIPLDGSGDYDSDAKVTLDDFYFVHECLTNQRPGVNGGPGNDAGPGCRFADFDADTDVDLLDFAAFQLTFTGGE